MTSEKIARVVGLSSSVLFDKDNPQNPINRRISIIVMTKAAEDSALRTESRPENQLIPPVAGARAGRADQDHNRRDARRSDRRICSAAPAHVALVAQPAINVMPAKGVDTAKPELIPGIPLRPRENLAAPVAALGQGRRG